MGEGVFQGCSNLVNITIPNTVTDIGYEAFIGCDNLENITIVSSNGTARNISSIFA